MFVWRFFRVALIITILVILFMGLAEYFSQAYTSDCSFQNITNSSILVPIRPLNSSLALRYPQYGLFIYCQTRDCLVQVHNGSYFNQPGNVPVLFISGSADPIGRVKSLAKTAIHVSGQLNTSTNLNFFVTGFNMEQSALYGPVLTDQSDYAKLCIATILNLYSGIQPENKRPTSVVVIGDSMGGILARSLFVPSPRASFDQRWVHTIITLSTPHVIPVVNTDAEIGRFYSKVNDFWLSQSNESARMLDNVVITSLHGGLPDFQVRAALSNIAIWRQRTSATIFFRFDCLAQV
jgi:hypothetical protein